MRAERRNSGTSVEGTVRQRDSKHFPSATESDTVVEDAGSHMWPLVAHGTVNMLLQQHINM
jgi:hypothetical protein